MSLLLHSWFGVRLLLRSYVDLSDNAFTGSLPDSFHYYTSNGCVCIVAAICACVRVSCVLAVRISVCL